MAAKLLHSLADDNPDLQRQIGCMTGIFQIFDRHQVLTSRRLTHKRLPPGTSHFQNATSEGDFNSVHQQQTATETNLNRNVSEKQRLSTESSRASFSSSCSSSLSSLDCGKTAQQEASSFDRMIFPETPSRDPVMHQGSTSPHLGRHSLDLRDVVKDSMYREARGLSVKTAASDESAGRSLKHKDSPRPFQLSKSGDGSYDVGVSGKQSMPADIKESLRVLAKFREVPWYYNEGRDLSRSQYEVKEGSWLTISKDAPRLSYDGKEMNRLSLDSRETFKSTPKLKEMPRLSLDGRDGPIRRSNSDSKPNYPFKNFQDGVISNNKDINLPQALATQKRPPSVVAKLMGLEALPDSTAPSDSRFGLIKTPPVEERDHFSRSLKSNGQNKPIRVSNSPRSSMKEPPSPRWRNPDLIMKPVSSSKFPIEPAPWRQPDGSRDSQKTAFRPVKVPARTANSFPSVYSEIEERLKDLEFKQSGKDLRALKQILEAMQAKGLIETSKEEQASNFETQRDYELKSSSPNLKSRNQQNLQSKHVIASTTRGSHSSRTFDSPIVIMKPAKLVQKSNIPSSSAIPVYRLSSPQKLQSKGSEDSKKASVKSRAAKDQSPRSSRIESTVSSSDKKISGKNTRSTMQSSPKPQQLPRESITNSTRSSGSVSPRLQQKKNELDKRSRPPTPPADVSKPRRQSNRQLIESGSPGGRLKQKFHHLQQADDQMSQISNESRTSSHYGDDSSVQSDSNLVLDSRIDMEVTSSERCIEINGSQSPSMRAAKHTISGSEQKKSTPRLSEDGSLAELATATAEHPSPVSVMDASALRGDDPSPIKQMSNALKGDIAQISSDCLNEDQWTTADNLVSDGTGSGVTTEISRKKLQNIEHLVQKLRRLNSSHDEAGIDYIASLCENTNPDHRYISEILLASGLLLRDLGSSLTTFQLHPSGHPINPELFFVLEQTNASTFCSKGECSPVKVSHSTTDPEKVHRKLIFDSVNEILVGKLASVGTSPEPWLKTKKLASNTLSAQKLLKELCSEIEQLQAKKLECSLEDEEDDLKSILWEDVKHRSGSWTNFDCEISGVVLDVERLLFKDLVDEILMGEAASLRGKPGRRRKLFVK
ncbi:protein LONGIFOLIA 1-like [Pistacia vera]|uniref:protein LONGIFOLIA 1-like n=1 Tax=Pistacia vera TaxID=55513 RepID=UPI001262F13D|nr:protein LONGIFOLIA 1-like [Pistacia vera]